LVADGVSKSLGDDDLPTTWLKKKEIRREKQEICTHLDFKEIFFYLKIHS
tara:strand:- start:18 stop:167 length:150 start_codon:yes stop_codon:yes gene_type:complete